MAVSVASSAAAWRPRANPWVIALSVMLATFMEVLDTSVANVSLPHIAGELGAGTEESLWVLTSYLVANAVILPAAGWLAARFGRKRLLLTCATGNYVKVVQRVPVKIVLDERPPSGYQLGPGMSVVPTIHVR